MDSRQGMEVAVVGLGPHGQRWLKVIGDIPQLNLVGIVDQKLEKINSVDSEVGKFTSIEELFKTYTIKVLIIATNGPSHASIAIKAMNLGAKFILVEKPMACSISECDEMIRLATTLNVRLAVDKVNRHDPVYQFIKTKIDSKEWGELRSIYIQKPGIGLGCIGIHSFDSINYLIGESPKRVTGWLDKVIQVNPRGNEFSDPGGLVVLEYTNGLRAVISQIEDGAGPQTMEINLTAARINHDPKSNVLNILVRDLSIKRSPGRQAVYENYKIPDDLNVTGNMLIQMRSVLEELIDSKPMLTDARFGKDAVEVLVAAYISHSNGNTPVDIPLLDKDTINLFLPIT